MRALLIPADGGPTIDLVKDLSIVGRKEDCDVRVDHKSVSKQHCVLVKTDGALLVRDLGSTNGTRVNGQRVRRAVLLPNDQVSFASIRFKVHFGPGEPVPPPGDYTVQMGVDEVVAVTGKKAPDQKDGSSEIALEPVKANQLPDVYPEDAKPADR
jgi:pSer/pThr/pTyr-binding forkhead associated (FHA) protein